jgi:eukaryotic-like serine/threonine-protein kinase
VLDAGTGIRVAMQICRALAAAHANGVVHRDMKPENVFLQRTADGEEIVKIVDFGIAQLRSKDDSVVETKRRLTRTGMIFGTPEYMAPEQASGKHADLRADIYAVGIIMYEMFTGAVPFTGETFLGVLTKHLSEAAPAMNAVYPDLAISSQLQSVIMRALEKDPAVRYQSMLEFAQAITGTPEAAALGYRPTLSSAAEHSMSFLPHAPGSPTAQQFVQSSPTLSSAPTPAQTHATETVGKKSAELARAETQLGGEAITKPPTPRSHGGLAAAAIAVTVLAGGGALFVAKRAATTTPAPELNATLETKVAAAPTAVTSAPAVRVAPATSAEPARSAEGVATVAPTSAIRLDVSSDPSGATLAKNGFQVCDSTPCEVLATPNETLEFEASKGTLKGSAKVLAQRDQKVTIRLAGAAPAKHTEAPAARMCEVEVDGLKILRPCK